MNTSEQINEIAPALVKVQGDMVAIKDADNPFFKSKYAPLDEILKSVRPTLEANGLTVIQSMDTVEKMITCTTRILHASGQWIDSTLSLAADKPTPQGFGSAATYVRRYGICAALSISTPNEDDDGNKAEENEAKAKAKAEKARIAKEKQDKLNAYKATVAGKLGAYDIEILHEVFGNHGYTSDSDDINEWIDDVVGQVNSQAKLKAIGVAVKEEQDKLTNGAGNAAD